VRVLIPRAILSARDSRFRSHRFANGPFQLGDELFSLTPPDSACYTYGMHDRQDATHSPDLPEIGRLQLLAKTIFDGTKLPLVEPPSQNHHIWYELQTPRATRP
jgi:hypothetical protein